MADLHEAGDQIAQAIADAAQNPEETNEAPETAPQSSSGEDTGADAGEELILGKFKDHAALEKAYQELEPQFTQTRQQYAELQRQFDEWQQQAQAEPEPSPFGYASPAVDQLRELAVEDPGNAVYLSIVHADELGLQAQRVQNELYGYWESVQPFAARQWMAEYVASQNQPAQSDDDGEADPVTNWALDQISSGALAWARQNLYNFEAYAPAVKQWMTDNKEVIAKYAEKHGGGPQGLVASLDLAYRAVRQFEQPQAAEAAMPQTPQPPPAAVRGQTRSTAPAADDNYETGIADLLLKSAKEQGMRVHQA